MLSLSGVRIGMANLFVYVLENYGSQHIKRIIFFGSLFPYAMQLTRLKRDVMFKLNHHMGLADSSRALLFPATFRHTIWRTANLSDVITPADIAGEISEARAEEISQAIVARTPSCIRYDRLERMVQEVKDMIFSGARLVAA